MISCMDLISNGHTSTRAPSWISFSTHFRLAWISINSIPHPFAPSSYFLWYFYGSADRCNSVLLLRRFWSFSFDCVGWRPSGHASYLQIWYARCNVSVHTIKRARWMLHCFIGAGRGGQFQQSYKFRRYRQNCRLFYWFNQWITFRPSLRMRFEVTDLLITFGSSALVILSVQWSSS